jgi:hypothetical protein
MAKESRGPFRRLPETNFWSSMGRFIRRYSAWRPSRSACASAEWYAAHDTPVALIDMDTENKAQGSLAHFFPQARKTNIHLARGLNPFVEVLDKGVPIVVADMGASAGDVAHEWFDAVYESASESGIAFTAIGIVTPDPASGASVLDWAIFLQDRVDYLIVKMPPKAVRFRLPGKRPASSGIPARLSAARNQHGVSFARYRV